MPIRRRLTSGVPLSKRRHSTSSGGSSKGHHAKGHLGRAPSPRKSEGHTLEEAHAAALAAVAAQLQDPAALENLAALRAAAASDLEAARKELCLSVRTQCEAVRSLLKYYILEGISNLQVSRGVPSFLSSCETA